MLPVSTSAANHPQLHSQSFAAQCLYIFAWLRRKGVFRWQPKNIRQFYKTYSQDQIGETVLSQSEELPSVSGGRKFFLSWSHYLKLMHIEDAPRVTNSGCVLNPTLFFLKPIYKIDYFDPLVVAEGISVQSENYLFIIVADIS